MPLCKPAAAYSPWLLWRVVELPPGLTPHSAFLMQEHSTGRPLYWGCPYRIITRESAYVVATAESLPDLCNDWSALVSHFQETEDEKRIVLLTGLVIEEKQQIKSVHTYGEGDNESRLAELYSLRMRLFSTLPDAVSIEQCKGMCLVIALEDHEADHWSKLSFKEGQHFLALQSEEYSSKWWKGFDADGNSGLFPRSSVRVLLVPAMMEESVNNNARDRGGEEEVSTEQDVDVDGVTDTETLAGDVREEGLAEGHERASSFLRKKSLSMSMIDSRRDVVICGWLKKKGLWGIWIGWKRRWFVLNSAEGKLLYYATPEDEQKNCEKGSIDLSQVTTVHETYLPGTRASRGDWPFEIHTPDREWMLQAESPQDRSRWIQTLNEFVSTQHRRKRLHGCSAFKEKTKSMRLSLKSALDSEAQRGTDLASSNTSNIDPADFSTFGSDGGEEITNKWTILQEVDRALGYHGPPGVEYIFVEPYCNFTGSALVGAVSANPYGHAALRYTLPSGEQFVMNIVGLEGHEMVHFLSPEEYFFGTNYDINTGNEQGGVYNRNFASIRVQHVPPEKLLAMHQYFLDLKGRWSLEKAEYATLLGPIFNKVSTARAYGNCSMWASQGLRQAGVLCTAGTLVPKQLWIELYETLVLCDHESLSKNVNVVYYKRVKHAQRFYGEDGDPIGWSLPFASTQYEDLEQYADVIIEVPANSKTAVVVKNKYNFPRGLQVWPANVPVRELFNDHFWRRVSVTTLRRVGWDEGYEESTHDTADSFAHIAVGYPLDHNCWLVNNSDELFRSSIGEHSAMHWERVQVPVVDGERGVMENGERRKILSIACGEEGSAWIALNDVLLRRRASAWEWVPLPSAGSISCLSVFDYATCWVIDGAGSVFEWIESSHDAGIEDVPACVGDMMAASGAWRRLQSAPPLTSISVGGGNEVWGIGKDHTVYRRLQWSALDSKMKYTALGCQPRHGAVEGEEELHGNGESSEDSEGDAREPTGLAAAPDPWVQVHGATLKEISVGHRCEVWGVDFDGLLHVWLNKGGKDGAWEMFESPHRSLSALPSMTRSSPMSEKQRNGFGWESLGNVMPLQSVNVNSAGVAWGVAKHDRKAVYRLSKHRLLVTNTYSSTKIWDNRGCPGKQYDIGFWEPTATNGYHCLGHIAERSLLANSSTYAVLVKEVGLEADDDVSILARPVSFVRLWADISCGSEFGDVSLWRPVPPSDEYVAMGCVATISHDTPPPLSSVMCVHRRFVKATRPHLHPPHHYLWNSVGSGAQFDEVSVWMVEPTLDSILCNTFVVNQGHEPPISSQCQCLRLSVDQ